MLRLRAFLALTKLVQAIVLYPSPQNRTALFGSVTTCLIESFPADDGFVNPPTFLVQGFACDDEELGLHGKRRLPL